VSDVHQQVHERRTGLNPNATPYTGRSGPRTTLNMRMGELTAVILEQLVVATVVLLLIPVMLVMVGVLRSIPLAQWRVSLALLCATALPVPSFSQGTPEQRMACTPDVFRLCSVFIPDADEITSCLRKRHAELSDACKTVIEAGMKQAPNASDRNRTARKKD
jgi:hypothetical protein